MSVSQDEGQQTEKTVVRVLRGARANDTEAFPKHHTHRTPQCLPVGRVFAVAKSVGTAWTPAEQRHYDACAFCRSIFAALNGTPRGSAPDEETTVVNLGASDETTHYDTARRPKPADGGAT